VTRLEGGFRLQASGFRLQASGFRLQASGFRKSRLKAQGLEARAQWWHSPLLALVNKKTTILD
jgi:hypothetical protein